jgi:hypothetical protein
VAYAEGIMFGYDYYSGHCDERMHDERRRELDLPVAARVSETSITDQNGTFGSGAQSIAHTASGHGGYQTEVSMRRQELLSEIASQYSRPSLSADEQDYLSRMSSTISTLNLESIASIDVLKLCIVCSRFYPRIDIRGELARLKSGVEAFLRAKAI